MNKKRILVIDDEVELVEAVRIRLRQAGYDVHSVYSGLEGLEAARREKPDLIILDLMLPGMDGYEVCGLLKADVRYNKIPIIIFTAKAREGDMMLGNEAGADEYITKPFEYQEMLDKIKGLLKE